MLKASRVLGAIAGVLFAAVLASSALASRNSAGTMAAVNGPYVAGTVISAATVNARLADIENELTASLERSGKGPMLAPLRLTNGTNALPSLTFDSDTDTGFYRVGAGNPAIAVDGAKVADWTATSYNLTIPGSGTTTVAQWYEASLADASSTIMQLGKANVSGQAGILTYTKNATAANSTWCLGVLGGSASTLCVDGNAKTYIGATGTGISASYRTSTSFTPGSLPAGNCASTTVALTGSVVNAECATSIPAGGLGGPLSVFCFVGSTNNVTITVCNPTTGAITPTAGTYSARVFNP